MFSLRGFYRSWGRLLGDFNSCCAWDPQDTFLNPGTRKGKTPKPVQSLLPLSYPDRQSPAIPGKVVPGGIRSSSSPPESPQGSRSSRGCRSSSSHICTTDIVLVSPPQQRRGQPSHRPSSRGCSRSVGSVLIQAPRARDAPSRGAGLPWAREWQGRDTAGFGM